jgi:hypothetical protein
MSNDNNCASQKDCWDKFKIIINVFALIAVPVLIGLYGHFINSTLKKKEIEVKYIEIAVSILREKPNDETAGLRNWAVDVLRSYSPIPINKDVIEELKHNPLPGLMYLTDQKGKIITDEKDEPIIVK